MRQRAIRAFLPLLALFSLPLSAAERPWIEVRSPNFVVVSNAGEKQARRTAGQFERIRNVFQSGLNMRVDPGKPIIILAARDENTLKQLIPSFYERKGQTHPVGIFQAGEEKHFVALRLDIPGDQGEERGRERHRRSDREIDLPRHEEQCQRRSDHAHDDRVLHDVDEVPGGQEEGAHEGEQDHQPDQGG